ncbi:hypothetical protein FDA94_01270 [Herbidospora galbida]|uniref:Ig-like domain-containing protein n=1 Tax=Herbidospora galbida TaxID=2575442 RepID=A0A4U3MRJ9_9ACTN|nr:hypothetical protein [Herbidospora galbida]TKK91444.1 hypothetical protein FDA94_01270 [Herbidospora galbida]
MRTIRNLVVALALTAGLAGTAQPASADSHTGIFHLNALEQRYVTWSCPPDQAVESYSISSSPHVSHWGFEWRNNHNGFRVVASNDSNRQTGQIVADYICVPSSITITQKITVPPSTVDGGHAGSFLICPASHPHVGRAWAAVPANVTYTMSVYVDVKPERARFLLRNSSLIGTSAKTFVDCRVYPA